MANVLSDDIPEQTSWLQKLGIAIEVIAPGLALITVIGRLYIRTKMKNLGWDDWWICAAMVLTMAQCVQAVLYMKHMFVGVHAADIPPHDPRPGLQVSYAGALIYNPILAVVRTSVLIFLLRLGGTKRGVTILIWILGVFNICLMIAVFFSTLLICTPIESNYDPTVQGKCLNQLAYGMATTALTIITDLLLLALPLWIFLPLNIPRKAKVAILAVFCMGFITVIVAGIRIYYMWLYVERPGPDPSFSLGYVTYTIETNLAIIAASAPALWPLARRWFPSFFTNLGISQGFQGELPYIDESGVPRRRRSPRRWPLERIKSWGKQRDNKCDRAGRSSANEVKNANPYYGDGEAATPRTSEPGSSGQRDVIMLMTKETSVGDADLERQISRDRL